MMSVFMTALLRLLHTFQIQPGFLWAFIFQLGRIHLKIRFAHCVSFAFWLRNQFTHLFRELLTEVCYNVQNIKLWKIRQRSWLEWNSTQVILLNIHNIKLRKRGQKKLIGPSWLWMFHLMGRFHNTKHSQKVKQTSVPGINFQRYLRKVQHFHILHLRRQYHCTME